MMEGASNCVTYEQTIGKRSSVVCAMGAYGKEPFALVNEQDLFAIGVAKQHLSVRELRDRYSPPEIGFCTGLWFCHVSALPILQ